jgi:hypothetical protein
MIIGLSGYAQSGKDTLGAFLVKEHGFKRYAFADGLKNVVYTLNPIVGPNGPDSRIQELVDTKGWEEAKRVPEVRRLLQVMGTEAGRKVLGENVWVDAVFNQIAKNGDENVVITDARFPNEAQAVKAAGGYMVRINRPGVTAINDHPSEVSLDEWGFDYTVNNDSSLLVLRDKAKGLVHGLTMFDASLVPSVRLPGYGAPTAKAEA